MTSSEPAGVGLLPEPPLSPPVSGDQEPGGDSRVSEPMPTLREPVPAEDKAETPVPYGAPPENMPIEPQLVRLGLLTVGQLAEAHRQRLESGRPVLEIAIEKGWLDPEEIERLGGPPANDPEPVTEQPPPAAESAAPEAPTTPFRVVLHLSDGEKIEVGATDGEEPALALARETVANLTQPRADQWPFFSGRFIRPDVIVSVDVVAGEAETA